MEDVIIYTDGACSGNPGPGGWGSILMYKENKKEKKQICVNLSIETYNLLEKNAEKRKLDKTNYIAHLIQNDRDDMYSEEASKALNKITCSAENLLQSVEKDDKIRPFVIEIRDGVKELWQYLQ